MSCSAKTGTCCGGPNIGPPSCAHDNSCAKCTKNRDFFFEADVFGGGIPTSCNACKWHPNTVKDYFTLEGTTDVGTISLRRSVDVKRIRIDNDTPYRLGIGIVPYRYTPECSPQPQFILEPGSTRYLGVNMPGDNLQFIYAYDTENGKLINTPHPIDYHENQFVIRGGNYMYGREGLKRYCMNNDGEENFMWVWIQGFRMPSI